MAKRSEKGPKAQRAAAGKSSGRWTVRGVPSRLQRAAGDAARAQGMTVGVWLTRILAEATERGGGQRPAALAESWGEQIERRLARLEAAVLGEAEIAAGNGDATAAVGAGPERGLPEGSQA